MTVNGEETDFTVKLVSTNNPEWSNFETDDKNTDYKLDEHGNIIFLSRGDYEIVMTNSEVQNRYDGNNNGLAEIIVSLSVIPRGATVDWTGGSGDLSGVWAEDAGNGHANNFLHSGNAVYYLDTDSAVFGKDGAKSVTVEGIGVKPNSVQITSGGYEFKGGPIDGYSLTVDVQDGPEEAVVIASSTSFTGGISVASGKVIFNGSENTAPIADVSGGSLIVGGSSEMKYAALDSEVVVHDGGLVGGHGTIYGKVAVHEGGTFAPGNSIGTTKLNQDLHLYSGSVFEVEVDPFQPGVLKTESYGYGDRVVVEGAAYLAGTFFVKTEEIGGGLSDYQTPGSAWLVIDAKTGLDGEFESVYSDLAFLVPILDYDYSNHDVWLSFSKDAKSTFGSYASTDNQASVAAALETLDRSGGLYNSMVSHTMKDGAAASLDSLTGEIHSAVLPALSLEGRSFMNTLASRVSLGSRTVNAKGGEIQASSGGALRPDYRNTLWVSIEGSRTSISGDGNAGSSLSYGPEVTLGYGRDFTDGWFAGAAARYSSKKAEASGKTSKADVESVSAAAFGGKEIPAGPGSLRILLAAEYTRHAIDSERRAFVGQDVQRLEAGYKGGSLLTYLEAAYACPVGASVFLEPFAAFGWSTLRLNDLTEHGGSAALRVQGRRFSQGFSTLGLRGLFTLSDHVSLNLEGGWQHNHSSASWTGVHTFLEGGDSFMVKGARQDRDSLLAGAGLKLQVRDNVSLDLGYKGAFGKREKTHGGQLKFTASW
jgi:subtilase-type serine protease